METLYTIVSIIFLSLVAAEVVSGVILYRNRARFAPVLRRFIRQTVGLGLLEDRMQANDYVTRESLARLERKINYIGRHTKFERDQLRAMGVLQEDTSSNLAGQDRNPNGTVVPLRRS